MRYKTLYKPKSTAAKSARFIPYLRCSTDDQAHGDFTTIDAQRAATAAYIAERIAEVGGEMLPALFDDGISGTLTNRPGINALREMIRPGDVIVVTFMSRLGRGDAYTILEHQLEKAGARVEMVKERFGEGIAGYMAKKATNLMDGMYPVMVSGWVKISQEERVRKGYWCGGVPPFGTTTVEAPGTSTTVKNGKEAPAPRVLVADSKTQPILIRCYEIFVATGRIVSVLEYLMKTAPSARTWNADTVKRLLSNELYAGVLSFGPNRNEAAHEPIVPPHLFETVQQLLVKHAEKYNDRSAGYAVTQPAASREDGICYYLRGRVRCGTCGGAMTPKTATGRVGPVPYYECCNSGKAGPPCAVKRVNAHMLHRVILGEIAQAGAHPTRLEHFIRETVKLLPAPQSLRKQISAWRKEEARYNLQLRRLTSAISAGTGSVASIVSEIKRVESARDGVADLRINAEETVRVTEARRPDHNAIAELWKNFMLLWDEATEAERNTILSGLVCSVTMTAKGEGVLKLKMDAANAASIPSALSKVRKFEGSGSNQALKPERKRGRFNPPFCEIAVAIPKGGTKLAYVPVSVWPCWKAQQQRGRRKQ